MRGLVRGERGCDFLRNSQLKDPGFDAHLKEKCFRGGVLNTFQHRGNERSMKRRDALPKCETGQASCRYLAPMLPGMLPRHPSSCRVRDARTVSVSREKSIQSFRAIVRDSRLRPIPSRLRRRKPGTAPRNFRRSGSLHKDTRWPRACTELREVSSINLVYLEFGNIGHYLLVVI